MTLRQVLALLPPPAGDGSDGDLLQAWRATAATAVAISLLHGRGPARAVIVSAARRHQRAMTLTPLIGFCNDQAWADQLRADGLPVLDAELRQRRNDGRPQLELFVPCYVDGCNASDADTPLLRMDLSAAAAPARPDATCPVQLRTRVAAPDPVEPATQLLVCEGELALPPVQPAALQLQLQVRETRVPGLQQLLGTHATSTQVWGSNELAWVPPQPQPRPPSPAAAAAQRKPPLQRCPTARETPFGGSCFAFDNVEIIGFRLAPASLTRAQLLPLLVPLNALAGDVAPDFRFEAAAATVVIELLRYGRMRSEQPRAPLTREDYTFQHELLVRLLVGRLDDDTTQARDPSMHVPAIFVDQPWSKLLGRELQGFAKDLAAFVGPDGQCLRPDGRPVKGGAADAADGAAALPLVEVREVRPQPIVGQVAASPLLRIDYLDAAFDAPFESVPLGALAGPRGRWRQPDFDAAEFRRSFARSALRPGNAGSRTLQVAPVDGRCQRLPRAFVRAEATMSQLQAQFPSGHARLELQAPPELGHSASAEAWRRLIRILGADGDRHGVACTCVSGEWYRVRCNMREQVLDDA